MSCSLISPFQQDNNREGTGIEPASVLPTLTTALSVQVPVFLRLGHNATSFVELIINPINKSEALDSNIPILILIANKNYKI